MEDIAGPDVAVDPATLWREEIRNGFSRAFILFALHASGVLDALQRAGAAGRTAKELAAEHQLAEFLLENVLTYLALADVVLVKEGERFRLTEHADFLFAPKTMHMLYNNVGSYACILYELLPALRGQKKYGQDFVRRGDYLAIGTRNITVESHPGIVAAVERTGAKTVADLGCGSAHMLVKLCGANRERRGVGIDLSEGALAEARRTVDTAGLGERIALVRGDVGAPDSWAKDAQDVELFVCVAVLHEMLSDGEDAVLRVLTRMKHLFPGRYFVMAEFDRREDEEFAAIPVEFRYRFLFYQYLMHPLSNQGLLPRRKWLDLFERAGIEVLSVEAFNLDVYVTRF